MKLAENVTKVCANYTINPVIFYLRFKIFFSPNFQTVFMNSKLYCIINNANKKEV